MMKKLVIGILAHVDAGKTTLSEGLLYRSGKIGKLGRVDKKDAYLDIDEMERVRGITIFSKPAMIDIGETQITLLDTPGHVDFSAEMERTLQVLDYAVLVISGADGVQGHTRTLWQLLEQYNLPVFLFINKMDQYGTDKNCLIREIKDQLNDSCIDFGPADTEDFHDELAMCEENMMETYLEYGQIEADHIRRAIVRRQVFPCFFGSALKLEGIDSFMQGIENYTIAPSYSSEWGARIFKITRDEQGNRLTHMKITGGMLKVRDVLTNGRWEEKVNQIRIYSGEKFTAANEIEAGSICAVTGLTETRPGEGLGIEETSVSPILEPVLSYQIILPEGCNPRVMIPKLRQLEEEEPELHIVWDEQLEEIQVHIMGEVQTEILQNLIESRFDVKVTFGEGKIVYKETIAAMVEGVGHFEPLRHYAEVHLLLEPGEPGSGLHFKTECSEDVLGKNWQRLVLTHLAEKTHKGILTGSAITDMIITLVSGRAHNKHTEGGDFREATYRAVRHGLRQAESVLLEPYYSFRLELPENMVGRAMTDIEKMKGTCEVSKTDGEIAVLTGSAPVVTMKNYQKEVITYTKGLGRLSCNLLGYKPCHNTEEVIQRIGYDAERDLDNPTGSIFCAHGAGFMVSWEEVKDYMHIESCLQPKAKSTTVPEEESSTAIEAETTSEEMWIGTDEIDRIINQTFYANQGKKSAWKRTKTAAESYYKPTSHKNEPNVIREEYLLVDGYNIVFTWPELKELADVNMDGARMKLLDLLCNYQGIRKCRIMAVFDAYRVQGHGEEVMDYHNIQVVYTKEAQTADQYIEKFAHDNQKKYQIQVATSDGLQQIIIRGAGCTLLSARELKEEMIAANERAMETYQNSQETKRNFLLDTLSDEEKEKLKDMT